MTYQIFWTVAALDDLARIWMRVTDRNAVTDAAAEIDRMLSTDAHLVGESRSGNERVAFASPLGFRFEAVPDDRRAYVGAVWLIRQV